MDFTRENNRILIEYIEELHFQIFDTVRAQLLKNDIYANSEVAKDGAGDISYNIDISSEDIIEKYFEEHVLPCGAVVISEGLGKKIYPETITEEQAEIRILIDPIDGTREIMYNKRSAWVITAIAPNKGDNTTLSDVVISIQTELPITRQSLSCVLTAVLGGGTWEEIHDIGARRIVRKAVRQETSRCTDLFHGYAVFNNYLPGMRDVISRIADNVLRSAGVKSINARTAVFDDQYISSGGQLHLLSTGIYRFAADIRPAMTATSAQRGTGEVLCCHPYDIGGLLLFKEAGGILTDLQGKDINYPMDTDTPCGWLAYANEDIRKLVEPSMLEEIRQLPKRESI